MSWTVTVFWVYPHTLCAAHLLQILTRAITIIYRTHTVAAYKGLGAINSEISFSGPDMRLMSHPHWSVCISIPPWFFRYDLSIGNRDEWVGRVQEVWLIHWPFWSEVDDCIRLSETQSVLWALFTTRRKIWLKTRLHTIQPHWIHLVLLMLWTRTHWPVCVYCVFWHLCVSS